MKDESQIRTYTNPKMLLYAITDRRLLGDTEPQRREALVRLAAKLAAQNVDYLQIREKDLPARELEALSRQIVAAVRQAGHYTKVLLSGPAEMALASAADGVHLPSTPGADAILAARHRFASQGRDPLISISCHTVEEVKKAGSAGADIALFAPVFEKKTSHETIPGRGLAALAEACRTGAPMPVLALGGVTRQNARACIQAGAAGVAAIRMFLFNDYKVT